MSWKIPFLIGSDQPQISTQSWYPSSVAAPSSQNSSLLTTPSFSDEKSTAIVSLLKNKSVDELKKLLTDKNAYSAFVNSLDEIKQQNQMCEELQRKTIQLARSNLENEPSIVELTNQCTIIRTSKLASAQERLAELQRRRDEIVNSHSHLVILDQLLKSAREADEESELLERKLRKEETGVQTFVQTYKKLRILHHKLTLLCLSAKTSAC